MDEAGWKRAARAALHRAVGRAAAAREEGIRVACGFTANVDRVVTLDNALLARLIGERRVDPPGTRDGQVAGVAALLAAIVRAVETGTGTDLPVDAATQGWLLDRVAGHAQVGGTGAQAAVTLDRLGFPTLLHTTGRSPEQTAALAAADLMAVATPDGVAPASASAVPADPTMWHVALEFAAGVRARVDGREIEAPAANRVIVSHDPVNAAFRLDPAFVRAVADPDLRVRAVLVSGFSQVVDRDALRTVAAETVAAIRRWRRARPALLVHLELGAMPAASLHDVLVGLAADVDSIGMNPDELRDAVGLFGGGEVDTPQRAVAALVALRRFPVPRLGLHARDLCLSLTERSPEAERSALLFGAVVAATRARTGAFPTAAELERTIERFPPAGSSLAIARDLTRSAEAERIDLVAVAAPAVPDPAAAVGLGDSFTAGVLALL